MYYMVMANAAAGITPMTRRVGQSVDVDLHQGWREDELHSVRCSRLDVQSELVRSARLVQKPPRGCQFDHGDVDPAGQ
jgi:hypothetical protein